MSYEVLQSSVAEFEKKKEISVKCLSVVWLWPIHHVMRFDDVVYLGQSGARR